MIATENFHKLDMGKLMQNLNYKKSTPKKGSISLPGRKTPAKNGESKYE